MYRYDHYTDSFVRIDGEPNTGSTTVRVGVPLKEAVTIKKVELTDECIDKIADAVVRKLADRKTEPTISKMEQVDKDINVRSKEEPQKIGEMMTEEEFDSMLARVLTGKDEPQTSKGVSYSDHTDYDKPKTYVTWTESQTERSE